MELLKLGDLLTEVDITVDGWFLNDLYMQIASEVSRDLRGGYSPTLSTLTIHGNDIEIKSGTTMQCVINLLQRNLKHIKKGNFTMSSMFKNDKYEFSKDDYRDEIRCIKIITTKKSYATFDGDEWITEAETSLEIPPMRA